MRLGGCKLGFYLTQRRRVAESVFVFGREIFAILGKVQDNLALLNWGMIFIRSLTLWYAGGDWEPRRYGKLI